MTTLPDDGGESLGQGADELRRKVEAAERAASDRIASQADARAVERKRELIREAAKSPTRVVVSRDGDFHRLVVKRFAARPYALLDMGLAAHFWEALLLSVLFVVPPVALLEVGSQTVRAIVGLMAVLMVSLSWSGWRTGWWKTLRLQLTENGLFEIEHGRAHMVGRTDQLRLYLGTGSANYRWVGHPLPRRGTPDEYFDRGVWRKKGRLFGFSVGIQGQTDAFGGRIYALNLPEMEQIRAFANEHPGQLFG